MLGGPARELAPPEPGAGSWPGKGSTAVAHVTGERSELHAEHHDLMLIS